MCDCPLQNPQQLEQKLKPYENKIEQFQAMVFWRNPIAMVALLVIVESIFAVVGIFKLTFVPTMFLLMSLKVIGKIVIAKFGEKIAKALFKPIQNKDQGTYKIYSLDKICGLISCIAKKLSKICPCKCGEKCEITTSTGIRPLLVLSAALVFFLVIGTYAFNLIVVNLVLLLPAVIFHPKVLEKLQPYVAKLQKSD